MKKTGKLYGLGVGPGDPSLITLKAIDILKTVDIVFAASSSKNEYSVALQIIEPHISQETMVKCLAFPMAQDRREWEKAWTENASIVMMELHQGKKVAFITLGDPLTYSTYGYLMSEIQKLSPESLIETIPGITSYQAAAAHANVPLVEGEESLFITSGGKGENKIRKAKEKAENIVLLKTYRRFEDIYAELEELNLIDNTFGVIRCGLPGEEIIWDIREMRGKEPHYFSVLIIKDKGFNKNFT